jgi:hypothetical protein
MTISLDVIVRVDPAPYMKRPHAFHILYYKDLKSKKEKHMYLNADFEEDMQQWIDLLNPASSPLGTPSSVSDTPIQTLPSRPKLKVEEPAHQQHSFMLSDVQKEVHEHEKKGKKHLISSFTALKGAQVKATVVNASINPGGKNSDAFVVFYILLHSHVTRVTLFSCLL